MKYMLCILALLCQVELLCQSIKPLTVGDAFADRNLRPVLNAPYTSIRLNALSGKLCILDFFDTRCGACISSLPRLDSLQNQFRDSLSILVVCAESSAAINRFLKTNPIVKDKGIRLPFLTGDTLLHQTFPHYLIPHEVWINKGKVVAITEAEYITTANLRLALSATSSPFQLPVKKDLLDFNPLLPLRNQIAGIDSSLFLRQNLLTRQIDGLGTRRGTQLLPSSKRVYFINWGLLSLFQNAWKFKANRLVLDVPDPAQYTDKTARPEEWKKNNLFCYEGIFPPGSSDSLIIADLKTSLQFSSPLQGSWQIREMPCFVLSAEGQGPEHSGFQKQTFTKNSKTDSLYLQGHSLAAFTEICNDAGQPSPGKAIILNETGIGYPIDLVLPAKALLDPELLRQSLIPYHLKLVPAIRQLSVFVLTENPLYQVTTKKN